MKIHAATPEACELFMQGQIAYAEIERVGVRVDKTKLEHTIAKVQKRIVRLEKEIRRDKVAKRWKKIYGKKTNLGSRDQLADVLFNHLKIKTEGATTTGRRASTAKGVLEQIDIPFVKQYLRIEPMKKLLSTNLIAIQRLMVERDGMYFIHPNHNLNTTTTFRPSSDNPNWRNYPKRNKEVAALCRPIFIPRPGNQFGENDEGQIEVRVPAAITGDKALNHYVMDKKSDMHRDEAIVVYFGSQKWDWKNENLKAIRQSVKTNHVFAGLYGSPWYNTAKRLFDDINRYDLKLHDGTPLKKHLKRNGIHELGECDPTVEPREGTFVKHMRKCERKLWTRFARYAEWRQEQVDAYRKEGGLTMITGFAITGIHSRTEIPNYKIQGPAFHITLWSLIKMMNLFRKYKMKSLILGDIYDSVQYDIRPKELQDVCEIAERTMTKDVRKHWPWITVPLETEMQISEVNGSWWGGEEYKKNDDGIWLKA